MQGVDYTYNERDWLQMINQQNLNSSQDPGNDVNGSRVKNTIAGATDNFYFYGTDGTENLSLLGSGKQDWF